ncbi:uncharacterized protein LOC123554527 isoform X2 [Mercenaria mercenaria]|uniref:uncharacterized protein LOC123554527 isoform X2 n=1 Tax=Mercenaria mercenaria TaxID=6596 RepID=UPI001E1DFBD8|nr:uncharacterized protein LOC123554527 isoform X2 [Mercenaria mercenaria]
MRPKNGRCAEWKIFNAVLSVLITLCSLLFALNILVVRFFVEETKFSNSGYFITNLEEYPFFCDALSLSPYDDQDTFIVKKKQFRYFLHKNRYICSYRNLTEPLEKFVERKSRLRLASGLEGERYLQCGKESLRKPSGYLSASFRKVSRHHTYKGEGSSHVIYWDKHRERSFISKDLVYHKGEIKVPESRFYFLYSSILINLTNTAIHFGRADRFLLQVCVKSRGYERTLLYKSQVYKQTEMSSVSSLAVGGHVFIAKGDVVYVKVSEASRLIRNSFGNTFGIMPLR